LNAKALRLCSGAEPEPIITEPLATDENRIGPDKRDLLKLGLGAGERVYKGAIPGGKMKISVDSIEEVR
jgi:hypothetical protein